jgi:hypothetical protein
LDLIFERNRRRRNKMKFDPDTKLDAGWVIVIIFIIGWLCCLTVIVNGIVKKLGLDPNELWNLGIERIK